MVHDVSVCRRAFELVSVKCPRTAASRMADVRGPPPRCTEITCTAIFVCILDRGRFWGVDTAQYQSSCTGSSRNGAERGSGTGIRTSRRLCSTTLPGKSCRGRPRRRRSHRHRHGPVRQMDQLGRNHLCDYTEVAGSRFRTAVFSLTVNFRSRDAPRWGRYTRGSNPAENRGRGTSSCSNAV